jgi:predicted O-methyltransferase YrrM
MALALPSGGSVVTLDVNADWADLGRSQWRAAGVEDRIELRLGLAMDSLDRLLAEGAASSFDLAYIDADKKDYDGYYERALALIRPGGVVALDNVLWRGEVANTANKDHQTQALRALNAKIHGDGRVNPVLLPIGDGLTLARRR